MKHTKSAAKLITLPALIGGGVALIAALLTRLTVGSPLAVAHKLEVFLILPPLWLMSLLWLFSFLLMGAAAGHLLASPMGSAKREAYLWRGSTFMVLAVVFSLVWYTLLFGKLFLLPSWICLLLSAAAAFACALSWRQVARGAAAAALGFALWQITLFLLQFAVLLHM